MSVICQNRKRVTSPGRAKALKNAEAGKRLCMELGRFAMAVCKRPGLLEIGQVGVVMYWRDSPDMAGKMIRRRLDGFDNLSNGIERAWDLEEMSNLPVLVMALVSKQAEAEGEGDDGQ